MQPQSLAELNTTKYKGLPVTFVRFGLGSRPYSASPTSPSASIKRRPSRLGLSMRNAAAAAAASEDGDIGSLTPMAATSSSLIGQGGDATWEVDGTGAAAAESKEDTSLTIPAALVEPSSAEASVGGASETMLRLELFVAKSIGSSGYKGERLVGAATVPCSSLVIGQSANVVFGKPKKKGFEARATFHFTVSYDSAREGQDVALLNDGLLDGAQVEPPEEPKKFLFREPFLDHAFTCLSRCQLKLAEMAPETARQHLEEVLSTFDVAAEEEDSGALSFPSLLELVASIKTGTGGVVVLQTMGDESMDDSKTPSSAAETNMNLRPSDVAPTAVGIAAIGRDGFDERDGGRSDRQGSDMRSQREQQQPTAASMEDSSDSGAFGLGFGGEVAAGLAAHLAWGKDFTESSQQAQQSGEAQVVRHDSLFSLTQGMAASVFLALWHKGALPGEDEAAEGLTIAAKRRLTIQWGESMGRHPVYDILFDDGELKTKSTYQYAVVTQTYKCPLLIFLSKTIVIIISIAT